MKILSEYTRRLDMWCRFDKTYHKNTKVILWLVAECCGKYTGTNSMMVFLCLFFSIYCCKRKQGLECNVRSIELAFSYSNFQCYKWAKLYRINVLNRESRVRGLCVWFFNKNKFSLLHFLANPSYERSINY